MIADDDFWSPAVGDSYDRLAPWYEDDMGVSMRFDDVSFYRDLAVACGGRTLELGCGVGRVLRPLLAAGVNISGIDRSEVSLDRLRLALRQDQLECPLAQRDVLRAAPPSWTPFDCVLLPYSFVTYWTTADELKFAWAFIRALTKPGSRLIIDAFVPRPLNQVALGFSLDYQRRTARGTLTRWKRITPETGCCNRIERRYQIDADGAVARFQTVEVIHPWTPQEIKAMARAEGFRHERIHYNYGQAAGESEAQFATGVFTFDG